MIFFKSIKEKSILIFFDSPGIKEKDSSLIIICFFKDSESTDKFILKLIDHNVNSCEIDITDTSNYIQIKNDDYIRN